MCHQITELYSECRCLYYQHDIDRCASGGLPGHDIYKRTILVGHACHNHSKGTDGASKPKLQLRPRPGASRPDAGPCHPTISKDCTAGEGARRAEMLASLGRRLRVGQRAGAGPQKSEITAQLRVIRRVAAENVVQLDDFIAKSNRPVGPRTRVPSPPTSLGPTNILDIMAAGEGPVVVQEDLLDGTEMHHSFAGRTDENISAQEIIGSPTPEGRPVNDPGSQKQLPRPSPAVKPHKVAVKERRWDKLAFRKHEPVLKRAAPP